MDVHGPGDVIAGRYALIRLLGGGDAGQVWLAIDRQVGREVALRVVGPGDPVHADALLEEARRMAAVFPHSPAALEVFDLGALGGGGAYAATELVSGVPLEEVARGSAPLPFAQATGYAIELLDACITARHHVPDGGDTVVASAMLADDGRIRVTRFSAPSAPGPAGADPAVAATAATLRDLLARGPVPASLIRTIDDALTGRVRTPEELRGRLLEEVRDRTPPAVTPPPPAILPEPSNRWPWIAAALAVLLVIVGVALFLALRGDDQPRVPDVAGRSAADAVAVVREKGFAPQTTPQASADVPAGIAIGTSPPAGTAADRGSRVVIAVSQGPGGVAVPTVIGLSQQQAAAQLTAAGLSSRVLAAVSTTVPQGSVMAQDPTAGLRVPPGSVVAITVSSGPPAATTVTVPAPVPAPTATTTVAVPALTGQTIPAAVAALGRAGLRPGSVRKEPRTDVPAGQITTQSPAAGVQVAPGTSVDVTVATAGG